MNRKIVFGVECYAGLLRKVQCSAQYYIAVIYPLVKEGGIQISIKK